MPVEFRNRVNRIKAKKLKTKDKLQVNEEVINADIHTMFDQYNKMHFNSELSGKVQLEWSKLMTQCAGLCYYD